MLDGYKSSGGSPINLEAVMMVTFNQLEGNDHDNAMAQSQTHFNYQRQQKKEMEEQSTIIRQSTAHVMSNGNLLSTKAWACWSRRVLSTTAQFYRSITRPNIHSTFQSILQSIKSFSINQPSQS